MYSIPKKIILSRTDNIGDVVLTLPMAGVLKNLHPDYKIFFLGKRYIKSIIDCCEYIDGFIDWDEVKTLEIHKEVEELRSIRADVIIHVFPDKQISRLAKSANIPLRIGTSHRWFHWLWCNKLINLGRKNSPFHEALLNLKLLQSIGVKEHYALSEIWKFYGLTKIKPLNEETKRLIDEKKFNLILHPKTRGSAREWGLDNFSRLIEILPKERFKIFITGTAEEGEVIKKEILNASPHPFLTDLTGKLLLDELISFIAEVDGIVACSTGPLHIAAALGKYAVGLYSPLHPIHPRRWAPLGKNATYLVTDKKCNACRKSLICECIREISPEAVKNKLMTLTINFGKTLLHG